MTKLNVAIAQEHVSVDLEDLQWKNRVMVIIAPDSTQKFAAPLLNQVERYQKDFLDRDMVLIALFSKAVSHMDGKPINELSLKRLKNQFDVATSFRVLLIGKDGGTKLNQTQSTDLNDIFSLIDTMPMRKNEVRTKKSQG